MKKFLAILMSLSMILSLCTLPAYAEDLEDEPLEGETEVVDEPEIDLPMLDLGEVEISIPEQDKEETLPPEEDSTDEGTIPPENEILPLDELAGPQINRNGKAVEGTYGIYVDDDPLIVPLDWINEQINDLYSSWRLEDGTPVEKVGPNVDISGPGTLYLEYSYSDEGVEVTPLYDGDTFNGFFITSSSPSSVSVLIDFWPEDSSEDYPITINFRSIYRIEESEDGALTGSNIVPAGADGDYYYGTEYAGYERLYVVRGNMGYPIVLNALVPMTDSEYVWEQDHMSDWTANGSYSFEVAYCADSETVTNAGSTGYKIARLKGLDRFTPEDQSKLQAIIEHAYPFVTEQEMRTALEENGYWDSIAEYAKNTYDSEFMMIGTQIAIWNITNPDDPNVMKRDIESISGFLTTIKTSDLEVIGSDGTIEGVTFRLNDCINNSTRMCSGYPVAVIRNAIQGVVDYLNSCTSSIEDPTISLIYDEVSNSIVASGSGLRAGDIAQLGSEQIEVDESGSFTATYPASAGITYTLTIDGVRSNVIEAMYFESEQYQNFIGGRLGDVPIHVEATCIVLEPETPPPPPPPYTPPEEPETPPPPPPEEPETPPEEPDVEIPDEPPPLEDIPDEEPPLSDIPDDDVPLVDIPDNDVPMTDIPQTGDISTGIWGVLCLFSGSGLVGLWATDDKHKDTSCKK